MESTSLVSRIWSLQGCVKPRSAAWGGILAANRGPVSVWPLEVWPVTLCVGAEDGEHAVILVS